MWRQALCGVDEIEPSSIHTKTSSALKHTDGGSPSFASSAASGGNRRSGGGLVPTADITENEHKQMFKQINEHVEAIELNSKLQIIMQL